MKAAFSKPKRFGEILDLIFTITKTKFKDLFMIMLVLLGPLFAFQAVIQLIFGVNFFREIETQGSWLDQFIESIEAGVVYDPTANYTMLNAWLVLISFVSLIFYVVAQTAVVILIKRIREQKDYTVGEVIKEAFRRFWPVVGGTILFFLIVFGLIIVPTFVLSMISAFLILANETIGPFIAFIVVMGYIVFAIYLIIRWSFYFSAIVIDKETPGLTRSWRLTKKRVWSLFGLYIVLSLIIGILSTSVELGAVLLLGNSVLHSMIVNLSLLISTLIFSVSYAVIYYDLKIRNDADDLKELLDDYVTKD
ncbi:glycerophosphoryl diester phosphodiesterase membrane domain-containing protein [Bacillus sp. JCM 19034]|uniref:glycerophosphoryl diester phosphodiesterase membrane domain-containing protein n=1 Tax=Bacillus sp. JCM 19034 TaxID=1481928 RepID=UPI000781058C|nr:glycerophosphoryl diester phosphodiesterase membrane domain-containing protein [Bacillus sp. JCM 19034]